MDARTSVAGLCCGLGLMVADAAAGAWRAPEVIGTVDNFNSYTGGANLIGQGPWTILAGTVSGTTVVDLGAGNKLARHAARGTGEFERFARALNLAEFGTLSTDFRITGFNTTYGFYTCGPGALPSCKPHARFVRDGNGTAIEVMGPEGRLQRWDSPLQVIPGTTHEFAVRVRALDGHSILFVDGRPVLLASDGDNLGGASAQSIASVGYFSDNNGTGTAGGTGNTLSIDNIDDQLRINADPPGSADVMAMASFGTIVLGQSPSPFLVASGGAPISLSTNYYNHGPATSENTQLVLQMSDAFGYSSDDCGGFSVTDAGNRYWAAGTIFAGAGDIFQYCHVELTAPTVADDYAIDAWITPAGAGATPDPSGDNNLRRLQLTVMSSLPGTRCSTGGGSDCGSVVPDDEGNAGLESTITVSGCSSVQNVRVGVQAVHDDIGQLQFVLRPPVGQGSEVNLAGNICAGNRALDHRFRDDAEFAVGTICPPRGDIRPDGTLSSLNATPGDGAWTLRVLDTQLGGEGRLFDWSLELQCSDQLFANGFET